MIKPETVEEITQKLAALVPQDVKDLRQEFQQNAKAVLIAGLRSMDLVTREEFDVQKAVLAKTRKKLSELEKQIQALEAGLQKNA